MKTATGSTRSRHFDGANYAFVDGHVKWMKGPNISPGGTAATSTSTQGAAAAGTGAPEVAATFSVR